MKPIFTSKDKAQWPKTSRVLVRKTGTGFFGELQYDDEIIAGNNPTAHALARHLALDMADLAKHRRNNDYR